MTKPIASGIRAEEYALLGVEPLTMKIMLITCCAIFGTAIYQICSGIPNRFVAPMRVRPQTPMGPHIRRPHTTDNEPVIEIEPGAALEIDVDNILYYKSIQMSFTLSSYHPTTIAQQKTTLIHRTNQMPKLT